MKARRYGNANEKGREERGKRTKKNKNRFNFLCRFNYSAIDFSVLRSFRRVNTKICWWKWEYASITYSPNEEWASGKKKEKKSRLFSIVLWSYTLYSRCHKLYFLFSIFIRFLLCKAIVVVIIIISSCYYIFILLLSSLGFFFFSPSLSLYIYTYRYTFLLSSFLCHPPFRHSTCSCVVSAYLK